MTVPSGAAIKAHAAGVKVGMPPSIPILTTLDTLDAGTLSNVIQAAAENEGSLSERLTKGLVEQGIDVPSEANARTVEEVPALEDIVTDSMFSVMDDLRDLARALRASPVAPVDLSTAANQLRRLMSQMGREAEALDEAAQERLNQG